MKRDGKYRACLCALGYTQIGGEDFVDNFAPVIKDETFRMVLSLAMLNNWKKYVLDVETAFLYGNLQEQIYMTAPVGYEDILQALQDDGILPANSDLNISEDEILQLIKTIYGLVQAAREWYRRLREKLIQLGYAKCLNDPCLFYRSNELGPSILCVYVDDSFGVGEEKALEDTIYELEKDFTILVDWNADEYLGCKIGITSDGKTVLSQLDILKRLRHRFYDKVKHVSEHSTPSTPGFKAYRVKNDWEKLNTCDQKLFRAGIGILLHLVKYTRPEIANSVRELSHVMDCANDAHFKELLTVIKFVLDSEALKLLIDLNKAGKGIFYLTRKLDSDFAGNQETRKSITGWLVFFLGVLIAWRSKAQPHITLSSTEAELVAVTDLCCEILFCHQILSFLGITLEYPILVEVDNQGAVFLARNDCTSQRTKHIDTKYLFLREYQEDGIIKIVFVCSEDNESDVMTKNTSKPIYEKHVNKFMVWDK